MQRQGVMFISFAMCLSVIAAGFGSYDEIKASHPDFFKPGQVCVTTNAAKAYYVYNGRAVRMFKDVSATSNQDLRTAAQLRAERNLMRHIAVGNRPCSLELRGSFQIAREVKGSIVTYVFAVPVAGVRLLYPSAGRVDGKHGRKVVDASLKPSEDILSLLDKSDQSPLDGVLKVRVAELYFKLEMHEEAICAAMQAKELLSLEIGNIMPDGDVDALFSALGILKQCGKVTEAKDGYRTATRLPRLEHRQRALHELNKLNRITEEAWFK